MKKQMHIIEGLIILNIILICGLFTIKMIYEIKHEPVDTRYIWDIKFQDIKITEGSTKGNVSLKDNTLNMDVILKKENEFYEFTFDVKNNGALDAELSEFNLKTHNPKDILKYSVTYLDGSKIQEKDILKSNTKKTIKVRIEYPTQKTKIYEELKLTLNLKLTYNSVS